MKLLVTKDTVFKQQPIAAADLPADQRVSVPGGEFPLTACEDRGGHILATLERPLRDRTQWYIFKGHIQMLQEDPHPINTDNPPAPRESSPAPTPSSTATVPAPAPATDLIQLPGDRSVSLSAPIVANGHFTWSEATKNGERIPASVEIVENIILLAGKMEGVRDQLGGAPIRVTSWYRDPESNARAGGAQYSQHLTGLAVDFYLDTMTEVEVQNRLDPTWDGGLGYGHTFTHLDARGYTARFSYS